jgi:hypothetical protein
MIKNGLEEKNMASLLVVGADHLGNIVHKLGEAGFDRVSHVSGRNPKAVKKAIPEHVDLILVLTDYVNHNLSKVVKQQAKELSLPICFAKRSWCSIYQAIQSHSYA